jgi:protein tyrosine/serine phosphatase
VFRNIKSSFTLVLAVSLFAITGFFTPAIIAKSRPAVWATAIQTKGVDNFYKVSNELYRGKQPNAEGFKNLKEMGIKTIVNLREEDSDTKLIKNLNIGYEAIPMKASKAKEEDVIKFLKIVTAKDKTPVFVHCRRGADRTGLMCAVYRIAVQGWSKEDAIDEMINGGYRFSPLCMYLKDFINNLDIEKIRKELNIETPKAKTVSKANAESFIPALAAN